MNKFNSRKYILEDKFPQIERVVRMNALEGTNVPIQSERELVVNWIIDNKSSFKTDTMFYKKNESHYKLTVDTKEDYLLVSKIFDELFVDNEFFGLEQVLGFLKDHHF